MPRTLSGLPAVSGYHSRPGTCPDRHLDPARTGTVDRHRAVVFEPVAPGPILAPHIAEFPRPGRRGGRHRQVGLGQHEVELPHLLERHPRQRLQRHRPAEVGLDHGPLKRRRIKPPVPLQAGRARPSARSKS